MKAIKEYASKDAIYKDYQIAVRFVLDGGIHRSRYDHLPEIARAERLRIERYTKDVEAFRTKYPLSVGFCLELPVEGDTGEELGVRLVVLGHETGPEFFLPLQIDPVVLTAATAAATWVGLKVADMFFERVVTPHMERMLQALRAKVYGGHRIMHVEVRTADKGVLKLPFSDFELSQLRCVMSNFDKVKTLDELIDRCFADVCHNVVFQGSLTGGE
jgi:hypothetical protein